MRTAAIALILLAAPLVLAAQGGSPSKARIDREVESQIQQGRDLEVLIVLRKQPQFRIFREWGAIYGVHIQQAESDVSYHQKYDRASGDRLARARQRRDDLIVEFRRRATDELRSVVDPEQEALTESLRARGATNLREFWILNMIQARVAPKEIEWLKTVPEVTRVSLVERQSIALDGVVGQTGAPVFWDSGFRGEGQSVAVLDSGIHAEHPAFGGVPIAAKAFLSNGERSDSCFADDSNSTADHHGHGTHVAATIAGRTWDAFQNHGGMLPAAEALYVAKVGYRNCEGGASLNVADVIGGLEWVLTETPARVLNYSAGSLQFTRDSVLSIVFDALADLGDISVVVAAGNDGPLPFSISTPADAYNVVAVANADTKSRGDRREFTIHSSSSRGPTVDGQAKPDVAAPGTDVSAADAHSAGLARMSGTSMAAPHVSGALALLRQSGVSTALAAKGVLLNSTDPSRDGRYGWRPDWGWGFLNLESALQAKDLWIASSVKAGGNPGSVRYYAGPVDGGVRATLVWNRHISLELGPGLSNLDLTLFNRSSNVAISRSESASQNVEQVAAQGQGEAVLKVRNASRVLFAGAEEEPFILALSKEGYGEFSGPALEVRCAAPGNASVGSSLTVRCTIANTGDLDAFGVTGNVEAFGRTYSLVSSTRLAPGTSIAREVVIAASRPGDQSIVATASSSSYGEAVAVRHSLPVTAVPQERPVLRVDATSITLNVTAGSSAPAVERSIRVSTSTGANVPFTATSSATWLRLSPTSGNTPASLRLTATGSGLTAGSYSGSVTIRSSQTSNSAVTVAVRLSVGAPSIPTGPTLTGAVTARSVGSSQCSQPIPVTTFTASDPQVLVWFSMTGAAVGDRPAVEWIDPLGRLHSTSSIAAVSAPGVYCRAASLFLSTIPAPSVSGMWSAHITWNGVRLRTLFFTIGGGTTPPPPPPVLTQPVLTDFVFAKSVNPSACNPPTYAGGFSFGDSSAWLYFGMNNLRQNDRLRTEWYKPNGAQHHVSRFDPISRAGNFCFTDRLPITGALDPSADKGAWVVRLYLNDSTTPLYAGAFAISPYSVEGFPTASIPPGDGCPRPTPVGVFQRSDPRVTAWFLYNNATIGSRPFVNWIRPEGGLFLTSNLQPVPSSGSWCYGASIDIAGSVPGGTPGMWSAWVHIDGTPVLIMPFAVR
jgi:subtilisin family serine protease